MTWWPSLWRKRRGGASSLTPGHSGRESLAGLDSVDWKKFRPRDRRDADRDACEIPDLIRGLATAEGQAAREWGAALRGALVHGHSGLYFRTVEPAAPFLIELCRSERPEVAAEALDLLRICIGDDGPFHPGPWRPGDSRELSELVARARAIVHTGRTAYYPWLRSPHVGARFSALVPRLTLAQPEARPILPAEGDRMPAELW